jgi:hypothetical protein
MLKKTTQVNQSNPRLGSSDQDNLMERELIKK